MSTGTVNGRRNLPSQGERQKEKETPELDGGRTKRGAASRAASKFKSDMEDRNRFEKEIKHGQVMGSWEGKRGLYKRERDPELLTNAPYEEEERA